MKDYEKRIQNKLDDLDKRSLLRKLRQQVSGTTDFTSNDYLGLGRSPELSSMISEGYRALSDTRNGSGGSRLLSGNSKLAEDVEQQLSTIFQSESALLYTSGYTANTGVLSCIPSRGDTILYDEYAHACIKEGARLSLAKRFPFRHNDLGDLKRKLEKCQGTAYIAVEGIYSMDGDSCQLQDLIPLANQYNAVLVLDEAHSTGVGGSGGGGQAVAMGLADQVDIRIMTFGKAMGVHGACVATSETVRQFLINFSLPFMYTTAPSPYEVWSISCAFRMLQKNLHLQKTLRKKIDLFRACYTKETGSESAIQPIVVPGNNRARQASIDLQAKGYDVRPVLSPTVRTGSERLRICLHAFNDDREIENLARELNKL